MTFVGKIKTMLIVGVVIGIISYAMHDDVLIYIPGVLGLLGVIVGLPLGILSIIGPGRYVGSDHGNVNIDGKNVSVTVDNYESMSMDERLEEAKDGWNIMKWGITLLLASFIAVLIYSLSF